MSASIYYNSSLNFFGNYRLMLVLLLCCGALGCGEDKQVLIAAKVKERVEDFRTKKMAECRQNLLLKAEKRVDSLLLAEAQQMLQDSLGRLRPFKPVTPPPVPPIDSAAVKPLFKQ